MLVIIAKNPDGSCRIIRPVPEMLDPNSRTIRLMESNNEFFQSIKKVLDSFKPRLDEIRTRYTMLYDSLVDGSPDLKQQQDDLFQKEAAEIDVLNFELEQFEQDRCSHKDFSLTDFVDEVWKYLIARHGLKEGEYRIADDSVIPVDRIFRDAWTDDNPTKTVDVCMNKARAIHRDRMRFARQSRLAALDVEYQRAGEEGRIVGQSVIANNKQVLRDVTKHPAIDAAETPEQLKEVWPEFLGPRITHE